MEYKLLRYVNLKDKINQRVFIQFLATDVKVRLQSDNKTKYIMLNMVDKEIKIDAKLFGVTEEQIEQIQGSKVYNAAVDVSPYNKAPSGFSCLIYNIEPSNTPPEVFAVWGENLEQSKDIIEKVLSEIIETNYGKIVYDIIIRYWDKFSRWTAAKSQHHVRLGELLVHSAELVQLSDRVSEFFKGVYGESFINRPLLVSSAILHDFCKIFELDVTIVGETSYSNHAALSTHIMDILTEVDRTAIKLGIGTQKYIINESGKEEGVKSSEQLASESEEILLLKHCIAAHHGKLEYGSPIVGNVPEAVILHVVDSLDAEMYKFNRAYDTIKSGEAKTEWASGGNRTVYKEYNK